MAALGVRFAIGLGVGIITAVGYALYNFFEQRQQQHSTGYHPNRESSGTLIICDICRRPIVDNYDFKLPCGDVFHGVCLSYVFDAEVVGRRSCPTCRVEVNEHYVSAVRDDMLYYD